MRPDLFLSIAQAAGENFRRIENEGVYQTSDGALHTLWVTGFIGDAIDENVEGVTIFEEFSTAEDAIDFSAAGTSYPTFNGAQTILRAFN